MNVRFTKALMAFAAGSLFLAFSAVAQNDTPQQRDEHRGGQQQHQSQNGTYNGQQQPQNRPQDHQYQPQQQQPQQNGQYPGQQQQTQQNGQYRGQQQQTEQNGQYHGQQQPHDNNQYRGQQQQTHDNGQYRGQQQSHDNGQYRGQQQSHENGEYRGEQQHSNMGQQQYRSGNRPQQWGRPPSNRPNYTFRSNDRNSLRRYYANRFGSIDRAHRPIFRMGGYLPYEDLAFLSPVPPGVWGALPPIPYGYEAGYWDGYVIVYDPNTGYILYVSDLL